MKGKSLRSIIRESRVLKLWTKLFEPVSIAPLVTLRVAFGLLMLIGTIRFWAMGWIADHFIDPRLHFKYYGFDWVEPLAPWAMYGVHALMILACIGIILGFWYRISALLFALLFTYCELIDITYYLNHYYFVSLLGFLMVLLPANRSFSLDERQGRVPATNQVPRWALFLPMFQISLVYIYAGLAKINYPWLMEALPLKIWLPAHSHLPLIGWLLPYEATAYVFSWFGMFYDTFIVFFLLWQPSRPWAYLAVIAFHAMTGLLFQIGLFPLVMMAITLVFFSPDWHLRWQKWVAMRIGHPWQAFPPTSKPSQKSPNRIGVSFLVAFVALQILFPWRYRLYGGDLFWHEQGYRFSWRVMLMEKAGTATFYVRDGKSGREGIVDNREFLNAHQEKQMAFQPDLILQYAHWLAAHYRAQGLSDPQVRAEVYVTLNGRPSQLLIDPQLDLVGVEDSWKAKDWILPRSRP